MTMSAPRSQRLDDAPAAEVGVGRDQVGDVGDRLAGLERCRALAGDELVEAAVEVVAGDVGDRRRQPETIGDLGDRLGAAVGVEAAGVGHHLDAAVEAGAHHLLHLGHERRGEAAAGTLGARAGEDQHRQLGQPVAGEHVDRSALHHLPRRREPVAVEARAVGDADRLSHRRVLQVDEDLPGVDALADRDVDRGHRGRRRAP